MNDKMVQAVFCLDFNDPTQPRYLGYYDKAVETNFPTPLFDVTVTKKIVKYFNRSSKEYPEAGFDTFKWKKKDLLWYDGQNPEEKPFAIKPEMIKYKNQLMEAYPVGKGSWQWEHSDDLHMLSKKKKTAKKSSLKKKRQATK